MPNALKPVMRCLKVPIRHQHNLNLVPSLELCDFRTLFIQQIRGHLDRDLSPDRGTVLLHGLFLDHPEHMQGG
jgi:hypothetical protein